MSQQKAQLVSPIETFTPPGMNVTGVVTATSFVGSGGTVTALASGTNLNVGVLTATEYYGSGSGLTGVAAAGYVGQTTAAQSGTTTIDLSAGNVVYFTQDTDTTVAFANTSSVQEVRFIRVKDDTTDARTITWPDSIIWNGGTAPTLIDSSSADDVQIFNLTTRDQGVTWYGYEAMKNDPAEPVQLFMWGLNSDGQLGQNDTVHRSSPTQIPGNQWSKLGINPNGYNYAIKNDGTLWSWGGAENGKLGLNDTERRSSPTQIPGTQWDDVTISFNSNINIGLATKTDGTLWVWGANSYGELGITDRANRSSPTQIPGTQWNLPDVGQLAVITTKKDGTLWVWGYDGGGALGLGSVNIPRSSPVQIPGTQWNRYSGTNISRLATKSDGSLWTWGYNSGGQLGLNNTVPRSSPVQIPGTQWNLVDGGTGGIIATKTDGTLWSWAYNYQGSLGLNDTVHRSSPTQIPGTSWNVISFLTQNSLASKTDGTLWVWGSGNGGKLGLNDTVHRSSPTQLPGTNWSLINSTEGQMVFGLKQ